tara:strand:- start:77 stop:643 length:567 start_codon:yes stop_codon:yes gene_type:complete
MLEYFLLPDLKIDKELFSNKVKEQCESWGHFGTGRFKFYSGMPDDETLDYLDNTFKNAGDIVTKVLFNRVKANNIIGPHTDYGRGCTINIPICGDFANSSLDAYEWTKPISVMSPDQDLSVEEESRFFPHSEIEQQINYTTPICFDTRVPHGVTNQTKEDRFILGITFKDDLRVGHIKELYEKGELLI